MKHRAIVYTAGVLFALAMALTSYINSSFLEEYFDTSVVGLIYIISAGLAVLALLFIDKILTRFGNRHTSLLISGLLAFSLFLLALGGGKILVLLSFILYFITVNFLVATLDIFVEDFSLKNAVGKFRGFYLMVINGAWVLAQLISSSVIARSSFPGIYLISGLFMLLNVFVFYFFLRDFRDPVYEKIPIVRTILFFKENRNLLRIYLVNLILKFFFAWMIIYTPIYLNQHLGFGWSEIGVIFTIMLVPFLLLDYPLGILSDKIGEKKILLAGFLVTALSTLLIPLISAPIMLLWAGILFATRVGAAMIEVMSENYFFKSVPEEDVEEMAFFRNTTPLSFILGPALATPLLIFFPSFSYLFLVLGAILLLGFLITLRLRDVR